VENPVRPIGFVLILILGAMWAAHELAPGRAGRADANGVHATPGGHDHRQQPPAGPHVGPTAQQPELPPSKARIKFETVTYDFGIVPHGSIVRHTYKYRNIGEEALQVLDVRTSCGCTAAEPSKRKLEPGEAGEITVAFDTSKKAAGKKQRWTNSIFFRTNDSNAKDGGPGTTRLTLTGDVVARYHVIPEAGFVFRTAQQGGGRVTATAEILPSVDTLPGEERVPDLVMGEGPGQARIGGTPPAVEILAVKPVERDGRRGIQVECALREDAPVGILDGAIRIATGHAVQSEVVVPVRGMVQPPLQAVPPRLFLARDAVGPARSVRIVSNRPVDIVGVQVIAADGSPAPLTAEIQPGSQVAVKATPPAAGASLEAGAAGELLIYLSDPKNPLLRVPYTLRDSSGQRADMEAQRALGVRVSPAELYLGDVDPARGHDSMVMVTRVGAENIEVTGVQVEPPGSLETRVEAIKPGELSRIIVKPTAGAAGALHARLTFLPRPGSKPITVRVTGRMVPRIIAAPEAFQLSPGAEPAQVTLRRRDGQPLKVLEAGVVGESAAADVSFEPRPDGSVVVRAKPRAAAVPSGASGASAWRFGEVLVKTDIAGETEVRIPVAERIAR
jgi:hypothetical protein